MNIDQYGFIEGINNIALETIKQIAESLKTAKRLSIRKIPIRKNRNGITFSDLRIEQGLDAEQIIDNKLLVGIFKDYLKDDGLRNEVIRRVQEILDLITEHLRYRQGERKKLEGKRQEIKAEYRQNTNQSYHNYLEKCRNYSSQDGSPVLQEEGGA